MPRPPPPSSLRPGRRARVLLLALALGPACRRSSSPATPPTAAREADEGERGDGTLLGGERGLDHLGIAVKDLPAATRLYQQRLGFSHPTEGHLPNGIHNVNYYFADGTYLETLVPWDRHKAAWLAAFTDRHSGALFAVLSARSYAGTRAFLAARGIAVGAPFSGTIQTAGESAMPGEKWKTFFLPDGLLAGDPLYFIAYPRGPRQEFLRKLEDRGVQRVFYHDNTALGLAAVWVAVPDLAAALAAYRSIGLLDADAGPAGFDDPALAARGHRLQAGRGELWIMAPAPTPGPAPAGALAGAGALAAFLAERGGAGLLGCTLWVGSLPAAERLLGERARAAGEAPAAAARYQGVLGDSLRLPPERTLGVWMELAQHLVPARR